LRKSAIVLAAVALPVCAWANAVDDGNAGVDALNSGDYGKAVKLFTHAIASGQLAGDDKEFAYFNRGKAYLGEHEYKLAAADLKTALKLKPDDADAQAALAEAQAGSSPAAAPAAVADMPEPPTGSGWGFLADQAGRYFWYEVAGQPAHAAVMRVEWDTPQKVLNYWVRTKSRAIAAGQYRLDPASGKLLEAEATQNGAYYGTATATPAGLTEYFFTDGKPTRIVQTRAPDGSYVNQSQDYADGTWQNSAVVTLIEMPQAEAESKGYFKAKK
jgi:tetratricopeptide (TPR) repeat protein